MGRSRVGLAVVVIMSGVVGCVLPVPVPVPEPAPEVHNGPSPEFDELCGDRWWEDTLEPAQIPDLSGNYSGYFDLEPGSIQSQKIIPSHPFFVEQIRVKFDGPAGPVRIRLVTTLGRSYPDLDGEGTDLVVPIEEVIDPVDHTEYVNFEVADQGVMLMPTQHYALAAERIEGGPGIVTETLPPDVVSHALMLVPGEFMPWGADANFRMKLRGRWFCTMDDADRWFAEQPLELPGYAPHVTDVDGDEHDDLVLSDGAAPHVFLGDGAGGFVEDAEAFPVDFASGTTFFADVDNDGDVDAFSSIGAGSEQEGDLTRANHILLNDGSGMFSVLPEAGVEFWDQSSAAGLGDGNGDGALDLYYGNWLIQYPEHPANPDRYFEGTGDGTFVDRFDEAGLELDTPYSVYGVLWNDYNDDGHADIYVSNYHLYPNQLWQNQGDGTFVDVAESVGAAFDDIPSGSSLLTGGHSYGGDFGDFDNDGDMDLYVANLAHPREYPGSDPSQFLVNSGPPDYRFEARTAELGFVYDEGDLNATFADYDNDMDLDIAVVSTYPGHYSRLYRNDGDRFTDVSYETGLALHQTVSLAWADFDEDGDLDIVIKNRVFENLVGQDNRWIELRLEGVDSNRDALGARVWLTAGGVTQVRDVKGPGGHVNAQSSRTVHFGLADVTSIDEVVVRWIGGETEAIEGAEIGQRMRVVEGSGVAVPL